MKQTVLLILTFILLSCEQKKTHPYSFYYWRTNLTINNLEENALQQTTSPQLYTRFFDIDKIDGQFQPIATITKSENFKTEKEIVPVVFIMNRAFLNIKPEEISFLAKSTFNLIEKKTTELNLKPSQEIQIDCDWTAGTKDDYFKFLKELQSISKKNITSTLRLHQVKDKKRMGIPPVKKVYLMCYSTSSPLEKSNKNSILDVTLLKNYLANLDDYPIKSMDIALPIYSWGIVTNHVGKRKLINAISKEDLNNINFKKISNNEVKITKDGFYFGNYLNKGFKIKVEQISDEQLNDVVHFIDKKIASYSIVYYQLDSKFVTNHTFQH